MALESLKFEAVMLPVRIARMVVHMIGHSAVHNTAETV